MLDAATLKPTIKITADRVECPVKGCTVEVERQRRRFRLEPDFRCPVHRIYVSPSTFQYSCVADNLLWKDAAETELLSDIMSAKRESRMARDNSEDALTWNIFRYLERNNQMPGLLSFLIGRPVPQVDLVYWSYSPKAGGVWPEWAQAREEFELRPGLGSEADLIAVSDTAVFVIEAKLTASNKTAPHNLKVEDKYTRGGQEWHRHVFASDFTTIAVKCRKYQMYRLWLLGTWTAKQLDRDFYLFNLVREGHDQDIEHAFGQHIVTTSRQQFRRLTWEGIYRYVAERTQRSEERDTVMRYMQNKTVGYNGRGQLQRAFTL